MLTRRLCFAAAAAMSATNAAAQDVRSVEAHVHGEAEIAAALDAGRLLVTFSSPLGNLTGFEHAPRDESEQAALTNALSTLESAAIVAPNAEARCALTSVQVAPPPSLSAHAEHAEEHGHAAAHADIGAMYVFKCDAVEELRSLSLPLFGLYPSVTQVDATFLDEDTQVYRELAPGQSFDFHD